MQIVHHADGAAIEGLTKSLQAYASVQEALRSLPGAAGQPVVGLGENRNGPMDVVSSRLGDMEMRCLRQEAAIEALKETVRLQHETVIELAAVRAAMERRRKEGVEKSGAAEEGRWSQQKQRKQEQ